MSAYAGPNIIENGLVVSLDASNETKSCSDTNGVYFDGTGDFLSMPANAAFDFTTGNFTIEAWVYINDNSALDPANLRRAQIFDVSATNTDGIIFWITGDANTTGTGLGVYNGSLTVSVTTTIPQKRWNHIAVSKSGTSVYFFLNGTQVGTTQTTSGNWGSTTLIPKIAGRSTSTYNFYLNGYISNLRVLKGTALYTANFSPTRGQLTAITNTSLLTCQSATLVDGSTNNFTVTGNGNAAVRTFKSLAIVTALNDLSGNNITTTLVNNPDYDVSNGGRFLFNGTNQYITSSFATTAGQAITYMGWLYSTETTATYRNFVDSISANPMIWWNASGQIEFDAAQYTTTTVYRNQWVQVALSKPSGSSVASYYVNGSLVGTGGTAYSTAAVTPTWFNRAAAQTWKGYASNYQVYNRALTETEILQNFNAFRGRFGI